MKVSVALLCVAVFIFCSVVGIGAEELVGAMAPEISAQTWFNTEDLTLTKLRGGVVVVDFWAIWCGPCVRAIPHIRELSEKFDSITFISLTNERNETSNIESFVVEHDMDYPIGTGSRSFSDYGV